ncbi:hypothetical protein TrVE_jg4064 [Triparma verrucosa]|uniref:Uncharacterized protein n=2 Tax=Triparma TaxID=722752 RepID=A0A9W7DQN8_9STRA|nr:hypothetical protein TrST_g8594 [Triparma strigata]GMH88838.1 hypothetical protein TrVE_jg4064 [Triparma verrucosa]
MSSEQPLSASRSVPEALWCVFTEFASFGRHGIYNNTTPEMDSANWAKFLKACPMLVDHGITTSDIDLIFTSAKNKTDRKLNFSQFLEALVRVSAKKFPQEDPIAGFSRLCSNHIFAVLQGQQSNASASSHARVVNSILGVDYVAQGKPSTSPMAINVKGRTLAGEKNRAGGIFDKLTDTNQYTGVYKNLDGKSGGRINGYDGDVSGQIRDLSSMTRPNMNVSSKFMDV